RHVPAFDIAQFTEAFAESGHEFCDCFWWTRIKKSNHRHRRLLRARREGPSRRCAAENHDEFAAFHSTTSSARPSIVIGTSRPSVFAVLRLIINSNLVGACIGRSDAFSPFKMRST